LKATIGDLMSGRAFDNNCNCIEQQLDSLTLNSNDGRSGDNDLTTENAIEFNLNGISEENKENEPDSAQGIEFTKSLISIGKKLIRLATKELKSKNSLSFFVCLF